MSIRSNLMKIAGKDDFELDPQIKTTYIVRLCVKYGVMLIRGRYRSIGYKDIANSVFIGSHVKLYSKRQIKIGSKTKIRDYTKIDALSSGGVHIGDHCVIGENCRIECTGSLEHIGEGVTIGNRTSFGSDCYFGAAGGIEIGDDVVAGQFIRFHSENHNYNDLTKPIREQGVSHKGIKIGNNCWIGAGAVFLDIMGQFSRQKFKIFIMN
jgi:acetyltransferase-like isoleucine patch superfamily enzyme